MDSSMDNNQVRQEMAQVQTELRSALDGLRTEAKSRLKAAEWNEIEQEFADLDTMLERLKDGKIWLALVGKINAGKSSLVNAFLDADVALVDAKGDATSTLTPYERGPWKIMDLPGVMGKDDYERYAIKEAAKAHGHLFVIDGEPYQDELEVFDAVCKALPAVPRIVFVNKWDRMQHMPAKDRAAVKERIEQKMGKYVNGKLSNIVYGSAALYDPAADCMVRQKLTELEERMYDDAGTLSEVVTLIDPLNKAHDLSSSVYRKVREVRVRIARKTISAFGAASAATSIIPAAADLIADPGIMIGMVYALCRIMGQQLTRERAKIMTKDLVKACVATLGIEFVGVTAIAVLASLGMLIPAAGLLALPVLGAMGYYRYRRTAILGEVALEYIQNDFSWGAEGERAVILRCKERVAKMYMHLTKEVGAQAA